MKQRRWLFDGRRVQPLPPPQHPSTRATGQQTIPACGRQDDQISRASHPQHSIPVQTEQLGRHCDEWGQALALGRHHMACDQRESQQLNGIEITTRKPRILHIVGPDRHTDPGTLQGADWRLHP